MSIVRLDVIQLHGSESPEFCALVKKTFPEVRIDKVMSITEADRPGEAEVKQQLERYKGLVDAVMLDTQGGGTGRLFAWDVIPQYAAYLKTIGVPLIVAGGLNPDNIAELVATYRPDGVDVSSGVETNGEKDLVKIRALIERVNAVD